MNRLRLLVSDTKMQMVQSAQSVEKCVNFDEAEFVFDNTWDGFDKIAVFWRGNESYRVPLMESDTCKIPWEILRNKGVFYIGCIGTKADGTTVTTRAPVSHVVAAGAMRDGTAPSEPTPSLYAQLTAAISAYGKQTEAVYEAYLNGALKGEKGEQGETGAKGEKGDSGLPGADGKNGADGFSPTVAVKTETEEEYVLTIQDKNGSFDTPNLKGGGGKGNGTVTSVNKTYPNMVGDVFLYGKIPAGTVVAEETVVLNTEGQGYVSAQLTTMNHHTLAKGKSYTAVVNGTTYPCSATGLEADTPIGSFPLFSIQRDGTIIGLFGYVNTGGAIQFYNNSGFALGDTISAKITLNDDIVKKISADDLDVSAVGGEKGEKGDKGDKGDTGAQGADGADGFSPTVVVKADTDTTYILTITDVNGSYDTPNLKGGVSGQAGGGAVATVNGVEPDESGNVFLYGEKTETISVVDETVTVVQVGNDIGAFIQTMDHSVFVENATFDVSINGVDYMGICSFQAPSTNADGSPPMLIMTTAGQVVAMVGFMEGMGNGIFFSGMSVTVGASMPIRITQTVETVQTIPAKYLEAPSVDEVKALIDEYIEEALGGEY